MSTREKLHEGRDLARTGVTPSLSAARTALFLDADGTLLDIAPSPEAAAAPAGLAETLVRAFDALGGALAIVSGRRIEDLDRIFAPARLPASGVHGAQMRFARDCNISESAFRIPEPIVAAVTNLAQKFPGVVVEDKREAVAIHWRLRPALQDEIRARLTRILDEAQAPGLMLMRGHCVFEIKRAAIDKGEAVRAFMRASPFAGRTPVFVGDDITDVDGMAAAKALGGHAFSVSGALPGVDARFENPSAVRAWLNEFVRSAQR